MEKWIVCRLGQKVRFLQNMYHIHAESIAYSSVAVRSTFKSYCLGTAKLTLPFIIYHCFLYSFQIKVGFIYLLLKKFLIFFFFSGKYKRVRRKSQSLLHAETMFPEAMSASVSGGTKDACMAGSPSLGCWNISSPSPHPITVLSLQTEHSGKEEMLIEFPMLTGFSSMISDAANKIVWCPVSSHLVSELPAVDLSSISGIFVKTIWKHKYEDLLQGRRVSSLWGHYNSTHSPQMLLPYLLFLPFQVSILPSILPFFRHQDSGLGLRLNSERCPYSTFPPSISSPAQVEPLSLLLLPSLSFQVLPSSSFYTDSIPYRGFPSPHLTSRKDIVEECWL